MFGMVVLIGFKFSDELNSEIQGMSEIPDDAKASSKAMNALYPGVIDNSFLLLAVGLGIGTIVLAALVRISPIFLALYLIALVFIIFFCGILSNVYQEMAANEQLIGVADQLTFTTQILTYLPLIVGVIGSLLALIMYKSWRDTSGV